MPEYEVDVRGKTYVVTASSPEVAAQAAHRVASQPKRTVKDDVQRSTVAGFARGAMGISHAMQTMTGRGMAAEAQQLAGVIARRTMLRDPGQRDAARALMESGRQGAGLNTGSEAIAAVPGAGYQGQTVAGRLAGTVGEFAVGGLFPGSGLARVANVAAPVAGAEAGGALGQAIGGEQGRGVGRAAGALLGGVAAPIAIPAPRVPTALSQAPRPVQAAARTLAGRADPAEMAAEAARLRGLGLEPSLLDVTGSPVARRVRAAGTVGEEAGEVLEQAALRARANTRPAAIAQTRRLTAEQRTAEELAAALDESRSNLATTDYRQAYAAPIELTPAAAEAMRSQTGQNAVRQAMAAARDLPDGAQVTAELQLLQQAARTDGAFPTVSGRTLDYVRQQLRGVGQSLSQDPATAKRGAGAFNRMGQVDTALSEENAPGLIPAREAYRNTSQAIDVLEGSNFRDPFTVDPADYQRWLASLPEEARAANQVAVRQYLQDWLGGSRSGPLGSLDEIATSPIGSQNLRAVFGAEAEHYMDAIEGLTLQQRNAQFVAPSGGSRTAVLGQDVARANLEDAQQVAGAAGNLARGRPVSAAFQAVAVAIRRMGMSPETAEQVASLASDPNRIDEALALIAARHGPIARQQAEPILRQMLTRGATAGALAYETR